MFLLWLQSIQNDDILDVLMVGSHAVAHGIEVFT